MTFLAVDGLVVLGVAVVAALLGLLVLVGVRQRSSSDAYLEWNPFRRTEWLAGQHAVDMEQMLALHNAERVRRGEAPLTQEEYAERVARDARA